MKTYISISLVFLALNIIAAPSNLPPSTLPASGGIIKGKIVDGNSETPVEFSNIALYKKTDSTLVTVASTGADGTFVLENVPQGEYKMKITFVGYRSLRSDSVKVATRKPTDLGTLKLFPVNHEINEVVVKGERNFMENKIDRKVFYVDKNITAQTGNATDVLQQVPSVQVDADGNVSLRGSENVTLMINGKPTMIDKNTLLQQIPAASIDKIEIITNPSAKYDPDGTSGIINVVLKQGAGQGTNATVSLNTGSNKDLNGFNKYNGSINLNYNPGKLNLFASYSFRNDDREMNGWNKSHYLTQESSYKNTTSLEKVNRKSNMAKLGFDFNATKQLSFGASGSFDRGRHEEPGYQRFYDSAFTKKLNVWKVDRKIRYTKDNNEINNNFEFESYLLKKFDKEGHELKFEYSFDYEKEDEKDLFLDVKMLNDNTITNDTINREKQNNYGSHSSHTIQADYTLPINEKMKLELGEKSIVRGAEDQLDFFTYNTNFENDPNKSSLFNYNENIHAVYGTFSIETGKLSTMTGLRLEQAYTSFSQVTTVKNNYFSFFPSLHSSYKINEQNELSLSYSSRINRPQGNMLNPIPDYSNPENWRYGNPNMKPEYISSIESGYTFKTEIVTIQPTFFFRNTTNRFDRNPVLDSIPSKYIDPITQIEKDTFRRINKVFMINSNSMQSYGCELSITLQPFKFWNLNMSASAFQMDLDATNINNTKKSSFGYNGKLMSNMFLPKGFAFQLSGFYRSPFITPQGKSDPFSSVNLGLRKDFLKGKLTANVTANDIFNTMHFGMQMATNEQSARFYRKRESRNLMFGLTYKFGKVAKKKPQNGGDRERSEGGGDDMMF